MAEVGEGKRTAAALLWGRRGGRHYELLLPLEEVETVAVAEPEEEDGAESKGEEEMAMEVELAAEGPEKWGGGRGRTEEQVWEEVHQIQIQGSGEGWWYQGQEGPGRERRGVGGGVQRETGNYGQDGKVCWECRCRRWSMWRCQRVQGKVSGKGGRQGGWMCGSQGGERWCCSYSTGR